MNGITIFCGHLNNGVYMLLQPVNVVYSTGCWEMYPKKPIVKLLTVEQPSIVTDLLINKIYLAFSS